MTNKTFNLLCHIRDESDTSVVIWLLNIGVEKYWSELASVVKDPNEDILVNHVEEINLLLTKKQDYMIMRRKPDDDFLDELESQGFSVPHIICPTLEDESKDLSELVLDDDDLLDELKQLGLSNEVFFVPYGVSALEEQIAERCGLHLIGSTSEQSRTVNNKIFSKKTARELGLYYAEDSICTTIDEIRASYYSLAKKYSKVIVKMPCNSSGRGMWVIDSEKKLNTICAIIRRISKTQIVNEWLVEGWIDKKSDLNYQIYVSETGYVETFSIKEQIVEETLYIGSVVSARIDDSIKEECLKCGNRIGQYLFNHGFTGVFGVDALIASDGKLVPIIEINGRFTLSTYLSFLEKKYAGKYIYAYYRRFCSEDISFSKLRMKMISSGIWLNNEEGILIYNASTSDGSTAEGRVRVFALGIGDSENDVKQLTERFEDICDTFCTD